MTSNTAPTAIVRPAAHRRVDTVPLWLRATRPVLLTALAIAALLVVVSAALLTVVGYGVLLSTVVQP